MLKNFFDNNEPTPLDGLIEAVFAEMNVYGPSDPEYAGLMEKLERLNTLKLENKPKRISRDTFVMGMVHLGGILIIVLAERESILSTKALQLVKFPMK